MKHLKEIVVFGGSFDPPTVVHQQIVRTLLDSPEFDEVWVMPSGERTDKPHTTAVAHRLEMLETMKTEVFNESEKLCISKFEIGLPQPTETICTVDALKQAHPDARFWFVFGADSIATMHEWRDGEQLLAQLPIIAVPRHGYTVPAAAQNVRELPDLAIYEQGISSTEVRRRVSQGEPLDGMVSISIAQFIYDRQMYVTS